MGDMDFKTAGSRDGITACQMDMKVQGISFEVLEEALQQAHEGRLHILDCMAESITEARAELSPFAPQILQMEIPNDSIGAVIGPGGKVIQTLQKETNTTIVIEEAPDGRGMVTIASDNLDNARMAQDRIKAISGQLDEGATYRGVVKSIKDFGAFIEIVPGKEGLLHISEIDHRRIEKVSDYLTIGDEIDVKLLKVEHGGKLRLSRKALIEKPENEG
jgi:polyribonucleotide nucleotidyltransferase